MSIKRIPRNTEAYSQGSKNSSGFERLSEYYSDKRYKCRKCGEEELFTAEEQKIYYEDRKKYFYAIPSFCKDCWEKYKILYNKNKYIEKKYLENTDQFKNDIEFLNKWLSILEELNSYRSKPDNRIAFIKKMIKIYD